MRRLRPMPRIARPRSAYAVSSCARLPVTSHRLYEADSRGEFGSIALLSRMRVFWFFSNTELLTKVTRLAGLKRIQSG
jgi:hypothetical protein